jgi:hypothetical protein
LFAAPFALTVIACGAGSGKPAGSVNAGSDNTNTAAAQVGQAVRDGKFEFTVQKIKCGVTEVGDSVLGEKAQGQFCLVTVKVKNIGNEAQTFDNSNQFAYGSTGAKYDSNTSAGMDVNQNDDTFLNDINPGNSVTGVLVFDIPKTAKLAKLELHDSMFSDGVVVTVK